MIPSPSQVDFGVVRCICCKEVIEGVFQSTLPINLAHPERWDYDLNGLVCDECHGNLKRADAWLKHGTGIKTCTKAFNGRVQL